MRDVYVVSDNIISPLGDTSEDNFNEIIKGNSGVKLHDDVSLSDVPFYASLFEKNRKYFNSKNNLSYSKFESILIASIEKALEKSGININDGKTVLIISSTKGNISQLEEERLDPNYREIISLPATARRVADYFRYDSDPIVVCNACISSLVAIIYAKRMIQSGRFEHAVVAGADLITKFVLSGFQAFQAVSPGPCRPFDVNRNGINLGEAGATMILSADKNLSPNKIALTGGSVSNDANHISGPSMTGEELNIAIKKTLHEAGLTPSDIDFISAHGTATIYNDEMESKAFNLAGLNTVPVNSMKGYFGHTLGAAGLVESIVSIRSMMNGLLVPSMGTEKVGVEMNVILAAEKVSIDNFLKTASGFGGCNAGVVFEAK